MNLFSLIYDPITSSPFAVLVKSSQHDERILALTDRAREIYTSTGSAFIPDGMVKTPYGPLTAEAEEKVESMISGEEFFPLSEIKEILSPRYIYVGRVAKEHRTDKKSAPHFTNSTMFRNEILEHRSGSFISTNRHISTLSQIKMSHVFFDLETNCPTSLANEAGYGYEGEKIEASLGRSSSRRLGRAFNAVSDVPYSSNHRINRRVKSLIGIDENFINSFNTKNRILNAKIIFSKRRAKNG